MIAEVHTEIAVSWGLYSSHYKEYINVSKHLKSLLKIKKPLFLQKYSYSLLSYYYSTEAALNNIKCLHTRKHLKLWLQYWSGITKSVQCLLNRRFVSMPLASRTSSSAVYWRQIRVTGLWVTFKNNKLDNMKLIQLSDVMKTVCFPQNSNIVPFKKKRILLL